MTAPGVRIAQLSIFDQWHRRYADAGYQPRPITPGSKSCRVKGWQDDVSLVNFARDPGHGIGLRQGTRLPDGSYLVALDADRDDLVRLARVLVPSPCGRIGKKGIALFARTAEEVGSFKLGPASGEKFGEFLGSGSLVVIPPTIHPDTRRAYRWSEASLLDVNWQDLPLVDPKLIRTVFASEHLPVLLGGQATHDATLRFVGQLVNACDDGAQIESIVAACLPENYTGDSLKELPGMVRDALKKLESGRWASPQGDVCAPAFSDEHLAQTFVARHGEDFRYVAKGKGWERWDGARWQPDQKRTAFNCARAICREFGHAAGKNLQRTIASAKTRAAVVSLAQDDHIIAATADQFDADPWLLNTPDGTVELKTGQLRLHERGDYITKLTSVAPDPKCATPQWQQFLQRVTGGDQELQQYLKRCCGYLLTGNTGEHALFFLWGTGANGKSTFINVVTSIMADYGRVVPMEMLLYSRNERHPTELAGLVGARVATAIETGAGRGWDEPKIMQQTGGDKISARFMQQDFFDFTPQFKLLVAGNHKPNLRSVNEAIRRRLHLVPFNVTIPKEERDPKLGEKLKAEWPGILAWMIDGCREWQSQGLAPPAAVLDASEDYLEEQDLIGQFLNEKCIIDKKKVVASSILFEEWRKFAEVQGEKPGHQRTFNAALEAKGFKQERSKQSRTIRGLTLREITKPARKTWRDRDDEPPY
jgi:putative DNA primase/helicase